MAAGWSSASSIRVEVEGVAPSASTAGQLSFAYQPHVLDSIRGPLIVLGGASDNAYSLARGVTLPTETDDVTVNETQVVSSEQRVRRS